MTTYAQWEIPRKVWWVLASWGAAVLVLAGLCFWLIQRNEAEADRRAAEIKRQQDSAMCSMIDLITAGPAPVPGPAGDRGRAVLSAMHAYQSALRCDELRRAK